MTTGTKVFLAVFAAFIGVLVLYYGVLSQSGQPKVAMGTMTPESADHGTADPNAPIRLKPNRTSRATAPTTPNVSPGSVNPSDGILTESLRGLMPEPGAGDGSLVGPPAEAAEDLFISHDPVEQTTQTAVMANQGITLGNEAAASGAKRPNAPEPEVRPVGPTPPPVKPKSTTRTAQPPAAPGPTTEYIVQSGDTMSSIAAKWFGDQNKWSLIAKENPLADPNHLKIGQKLRLPPKDARHEPIKAPSSGASAASTYTVRSGDTLAKISREVYGTVAKWEIIYQANRSLIGDDPANLKPGMKLILPPKN